jgi:hypothetical protein
MSVVRRHDYAPVLADGQHAAWAQPQREAASTVATAQQQKQQWHRPPSAPMQAGAPSPRAGAQFPNRQPIPPSRPVTAPVPAGHAETGAGPEETYKPNTVPVQKWHAPTMRAPSGRADTRSQSQSARARDEPEREGAPGIVSKLMHCSKDPIAMTSLDFYAFGRMLGEGAFGKVKLAAHKLRSEAGMEPVFTNGVPNACAYSTCARNLTGFGRTQWREGRGQDLREDQNPRRQLAEARHPRDP